MHAAPLLEAINMRNTHAQESHTNKFLINFEGLNKTETSSLQFLSTQAPEYNQPEKTIPMDRYNKI